MTEKIFNQEMEDTELEEVVGGTGVQCMGILNRLKKLGVDVKTPLVVGHEKSAAAELSKLAGLKGSGGDDWADAKLDFSGSYFYHDGRDNVYKMNDKTISEDEFVKLLAKKHGK